MQRDLVTDAGQVHETARGVLDFWFGLSKAQHFTADAALDREIATRFGATGDAVLATGATGWRDRPETLLAAVILLDQMSRNIHRGTAQAFAADDLAVSLTLEAIDRGADLRLPPDRRAFLYMPLMHAEDGPLQDMSVDRYEALGIEENAAFARDHREIFRRFGRFPGRNTALGRTTAAEERVYLTETDGGW